MQTPGATTPVGPPVEARESLPVEQPGRAWGRATASTLAAVVRHPRRSFAICREPVPHGRVLRFLLTLRLPPWALLLAVLVGRAATETVPVPASTKPVHAWIEAPLAEVASHWLILLIPLGVPLLYFVTGLLAHIGLALTGGATRSIGASMRAVGYALAPALLIVGLIDVPLYLGFLRGDAYVGIVGVVGAWTLWQAGGALASTHRVSWFRGLLVAALPMGFLVVATIARAFLVLPDFPGVSLPSMSPYYIP